jgi:hypothetical protein
MEELGTLMIKMGIGKVIGEQRGMKRRVGLVGLVLLCRAGCGLLRLYDWDWHCIAGWDRFTTL